MKNPFFIDSRYHDGILYKIIDSLSAMPSRVFYKKTLLPAEDSKERDCYVFQSDMIITALSRRLSYLFKVQVTHHCRYTRRPDGVSITVITSFHAAAGKRTQTR